MEYCQCDLTQLYHDLGFCYFRRNKAWHYCPYCGLTFNPFTCPFHKDSIKEIKICGGIAGSEILGYSKECRICGWKPQ